MKAIFLVTLFAMGTAAYAIEELPYIGEEADEEVLALAPSHEDIVPVETVKEQTVEAAPINVDGYLKNKEVVATDPELETIRMEIQKQKKEIILNKVKAREFRELGKSTEQLSQTTEEMIAERKAAQEEIAAYNLKVKCMSSENPGPECAKFIRKRR